MVKSNKLDIWKKDLIHIESITDMGVRERWFSEEDVHDKAAVTDSLFFFTPGFKYMFPRYYKE